MINFSIRSYLITQIDAHDFPINARLTFIYLGGNPIVNIDDHAFDNIRTYLTFLNLENTKLTRLPLALKTLTRLDTLWMPNNVQLVCTCDEKSLAPWITSLPALRVLGKCGNVDIKEVTGHRFLLCP